MIDTEASIFGESDLSTSTLGVNEGRFVARLEAYYGAA